MTTKSEGARLEQIREAPKPEGPKFFRLDIFSSGWTWRAGRFSISWIGPRVSLLEEE